MPIMIDLKTWLLIPKNIRFSFEWFWVESSIQKHYLTANKKNQQVDKTFLKNIVKSAGDKLKRI